MHHQTVNLYNTVSAIAGGGLVFWSEKNKFLRFFHENLYLGSLKKILMISEKLLKKLEN